MEFEKDTDRLKFFRRQVRENTELRDRALVRGNDPSARIFQSNVEASAFMFCRLTGVTLEEAIVILDIE